MANEIKQLNRNQNECTLVPLTDIYETDDAYELRLEMPGVEKENLNIVLDNNELEITGKVVNKSENEGELRFSEYSLHDYYRKFKVGNGINRDGISAGLENGILSLTLQKSEEVKPKKIEVKIH